jgi:SNF2 family DNA or RNA helicase
MGKKCENRWDYMILDEGHTIKNRETKVSIALNDVNCKHRILMSGTPYQNNMKVYLMSFSGF